ncbi:MAG: hypothetical protein CMC96_06430 [Flavobacteriales bacterium]|nr:hypothetical protein [Flavobacteriales bacterium]|tara:strand:- start:567 stop:2057 length:1491 start_codon:yes stop_codon:yes gene_type:complete
MKKYILTYSLIIASLGAFAQNYTDALRFSRMQNLGTARFNAMGGSFGALGGDLSAISVNPAATGVYRNSEFTFTTALSIRDNESLYNNSFSQDSRANFNIGNIGYVGSYKGNQNGWKNYSFAIGHNRINNFHNNQRIKGNSLNQSSIIDDYVNYLNSNQVDVGVVEGYGNNQTVFGPSQAYWLYLINPVTNTQYEREIRNTSAVEQIESLEQRGHQSETYFSFGGNYQDRLYVGANISLQSMRFESNRLFEENYIYPTPATSNDSVGIYYAEETNLLMQGNGFNFKLGAIYKVNESIRLGASVHAPTFYNISEEYTFDAISEFSEGTAYEEETVINNWNYKLRTPMRYMASLAYVFKNIGLFNIEYEYVDYTQAKFDDKRRYEADYSEANLGIRNTLKNTHNIRVGAEVRAEPFVVRAGFRYEDNPYQSNELEFRPDENRKTYSLGAGFRSENYNIDLTYMLSDWQTVSQLYQSVPSEALIDNRHHQIMLTMGWKW